MALLKCVECGEPVSSFAIACPRCGFPVSAAAAKNPPIPAIPSADGKLRLSTVVAPGTQRRLFLIVGFAACLASGITLAIVKIVGAPARVSDSRFQLASPDGRNLGETRTGEVLYPVQFTVGEFLYDSNKKGRYFSAAIQQARDELMIKYKSAKDEHSAEVNEFIREDWTATKEEAFAAFVKAHIDAGLENLTKAGGDQRTLLDKPLTDEIKATMEACAGFGKGLGKAIGEALKDVK